MLYWMFSYWPSGYVLMEFRCIITCWTESAASWINSCRCVIPHLQIGVDLTDSLSFYLASYLKLPAIKTHTYILSISGSELGISKKIFMQQLGQACSFSVLMCMWNCSLREAGNSCWWRAGRLLVTAQHLAGCLSTPTVCSTLLTSMC